MTNREIDCLLEMTYMADPMKLAIEKMISGGVTEGQMIDRLNLGVDFSGPYKNAMQNRYRDIKNGGK
jgi:hypothetical protein